MTNAHDLPRLFRATINVKTGLSADSASCA